MNRPTLLGSVTGGTSGPYNWVFEWTDGTNTYSENPYTNDASPQSCECPAPGLIHHSDRGSPYASERYRERLDSLGSIASMSRKGDCWDNAVAESFFSTLEHELLADVDFATHAQAARAIREYIHDFYNLRRRHSTIGYVSPIEFELRSRAAAVAA